MKKALIFYGGWDGHTPKETAYIYKEILEKNGFEVAMSETLGVLNEYENIEKFDLFVPVWTMGVLTGIQQKNICLAVENGAGIAGSHGGMCDAFRDSTNWQFMTGAQWVAHPGNGTATYTVNMKKDNPFTENLEDFTYTGEQYYLHIDPAIKVYATTDFPVSDGPHTVNGKVSMPVVFSKFWGKGKVFYISMGHTYKDFEIPQVRTIMERGMLWATR